MLRLAALALALLVMPAFLPAQQATVSPFLSRALAGDTVVTTWIFGRPGFSLDQLTAAAAASGARIRRQSEWLHAVSAGMTSAALRTARARPEIRHLQPVIRFTGPLPQDALPVAPVRLPATAAPIDSAFGESAMPIRLLNIFPLTRLGLRGQGVKIAILDTGFETAQPVFAATAVIGQRDFVFNDNVVRNEAADVAIAQDHGTRTWSLLAAQQTGTMMGVVPDAQYILAKTEDVRSERTIEEDNFVAALEWAHSLGANIVSSSLTYLTFDNAPGYTFAQLDGDVAVTTVAADLAAQRGITMVTAMGNAGPAARSIGTPADADSAISAGAVDSLGAVASFSSRGPTADNRIKPDLTAPGVAVFTATPTGFGRANGTSFSTPLLAGAAALVKQIHPAYGPVEIRDALRNAASNAAAPDANRGWGTPDVTLAATFPRGIQLVAPADPLVTTATPRFAWTAADVPSFALPVRYALTVARDSTFNQKLLDTVVAGTEVLSPRSLTPGASFFVRLTATAADSAMFQVRPATRFTVTGTGEPAPPITLLFQNFPNPFPERATGQSATCLWFDIATGGPVRLDILDLRGHVVRNIVPGSIFADELPAGRYGRPSPSATTGCNPDFLWDGSVAGGGAAPQGIYLVKLQTPDGVFFKRIVYLGSS